VSTKGITEADKHADARTHYAEIFNSPHWEPTSQKASLSSTARCDLLSQSAVLKHPRMDITKRAAIFASFDALVGYKEAVTETARTTDGRIDLSDGELEELNRRLSVIIDRMEEGTDNCEMPTQIIRADEHTAPSVSITYFVPDATKEGGSYVTAVGAVRKIDLYQRTLTLSDSSGSAGGRLINIDDVVRLDGELFDQAE